MQIAPATLVGDGRYRVHHLLGSGGMAMVYAVEHQALGTRHALKVLHTTMPTMSDRLLREGRLQARLDPDLVVPVTDVIEVAGFPALVMPYVDGCGLDDLLAMRRLTEAEAVAVFQAVVDGVLSAHELGIVHRDLKPGNVLVDRTRRQVRVRVADFGLASADDETRATRAGAVFGTPAYAAPEQMLDSSSADHRADLWSLGVMLYELLTGTLPFAASSPSLLVDMAKRGTWDRSTVAAPWRPVVEALLAPDPDARRLDPSTWPVAADPASLALDGPLAATLEHALAQRPAPEEMPSQGGDTLASWTDDRVATSRSEAHAATSDAPDDPTPDAAAETPTWRRRLWRFVRVSALVSLIVVLFGGAAVVVWLNPALDDTGPMFTVDAAPVLYDDPALQRHVERLHAAFLDADGAGVIEQAEQLNDAGPLPAEILALLSESNLRFVGDTDDQTTDRLLLAVDPLSLTRSTGSSLCVLSARDAVLTMATGMLDAASGLRLVARAARAKRGVSAWLQAHPADLGAWACHDTRAPDFIGGRLDPETHLARIEALDPSGQVPLIALKRASALARHVGPAAAAAVLDPLRGHPVAGDRRAQLLLDTGELERAQEAIAEVLKRHPGRIDAHLTAATVAEKRGDVETAARHRRFALSPEWPPSIQRKAAINFTTSDVEMGVLDRVRARVAENPHAATSPVLNINHITHPRVFTVGLLRDLVEAVDMIRAEAGDLDAPFREIHRTRLAMELAIRAGDGEALASLPSLPEEHVAPDRQVRLAAHEGDPTAWVVAIENSTLMSPDSAPAGHRVTATCQQDFRIATAYDIGGAVDDAAEHYRRIVAQPDCQHRQAFITAVAAGVLALWALEAGEDATEMVELYQRTWPTADPTTPLARDLARHGVVTGPARLARTARQE